MLEKKNAEEMLNGLRQRAEQTAHHIAALKEKESQIAGDRKGAESQLTYLRGQIDLMGEVLKSFDEKPKTLEKKGSLPPEPNAQAVPASEKQAEKQVAEKK